MGNRREPPDDHGDAFNEDLCRILLGDFLLVKTSGTAAGSPPEDVLRHARPLLDELARIAREFEWEPDRSPEAVQANARRLRDIVATLADLLGMPLGGRTAA